MKSKWNDVVDGGEILKGIVAGMVGGFVASAVMNKFQRLLSNLVTGDERSHGAQSLQQGSPDRGVGRKLSEIGAEDPNDDAAERLANALAVGVLNRNLIKHEKDVTGVAFHYGYGISMGAFYGAGAEILPEVTSVAGIPYGAAIWLGADEGIVPLLGLSKTPSEYHFSVHALSLASHLVYGLTLEAVRRGVRASL